MVAKKTTRKTPAKKKATPRKRAVRSNSMAVSEPPLPKGMTKEDKANIEFRLNNVQRLLWDGNITETTALKELNAAVRLMRKAQAKK